LILLTSSYLSEIIGIHALFGAFLAGVIMPHNFNFKRLLSEKIEDVSLVVLLPLFFVLTGLRTEVGLLNSGSMWIICFLIIVVAITGKFGGSAIAAKVVGLSWKDSLSIGTLMNTRGLMELVVLNIGYDLGILKPEVFAMMVLMALITTLMTGPSLNLINKIYGKKRLKKHTSSSDSFKILISFGPPKMGSTLLKLASQILFKENVASHISALHMTPHSEVTQQEALMYEKEGFKPIRDTAGHLGIKLHTRYKATDEISKEIAQEAKKGNFDLLLLGSAKPLFSESMIGGKVKEIFEESTCNIGVLIEKGFTYAKNILLILSNENEKELVEFSLKFINTGAKITVLDQGDVRIKDPAFFDFIPQKYLLNKDLFEIAELREMPEGFSSNFDLVMVSLDFWKQKENKKEFEKENSSILIFKPAIIAKTTASSMSALDPLDTQDLKES
ncbi:MAG TPA: cation:proton antiporter, partial [Cytophagales bacterium]|nr:cation:proton antiporter [Cytophagales bacterium]